MWDINNQVKRKNNLMLSNSNSMPLKWPTQSDVSKFHSHYFERDKMIYKSKTISTIFFWQSSLYVNNAVFFSSTKWLNSLKLSFETYNVIVIQIEKKKLCSRNGMGFMRFSMGFFFYSGQYHQGIAVYAVDIRLCVTSLLGSVLCVILCASMCILQCLWITFLYDAISISCVMYWILVLCTKGKFQCINCIRDLMESFRTNCPFSKMKWFIFCCCLFALCHSLFINVWFRTEYGQDCRHPSFRVNS